MSDSPRATSKSDAPTGEPDALFGSLSRVSRKAGQRFDSALAAFELQSWEYDVLTTLLKTGAPYEMCPGTIATHLGVSNSAMTNRINRLVQSERVERHLSPENRRIIIIRLTEHGADLAERALHAHCEVAKQVYDTLAPREATALRTLLDKLDTALTDTRG